MLTIPPRVLMDMISWKDMSSKSDTPPKVRTMHPKGFASASAATIHRDILASKGWNCSFVMQDKDGTWSFMAKKDFSTFRDEPSYIKPEQIFDRFFKKRDRKKRSHEAGATIDKWKEDQKSSEASSEEPS